MRHWHIPVAYQRGLVQEMLLHKQLSPEEPKIVTEQIFDFETEETM